MILMVELGTPFPKDGDEMVEELVTVFFLSYIGWMHVAVWSLLLVHEQWMAFFLGACLMVTLFIRPTYSPLRI